MKTLQVLYQSDNNYAVYMGVSICSLLENNKSADDIAIYVIDDGIKKDNKEKILEMVNSYGRRLYFVSGEKVLDDTRIVKAFSYSGMRKNTHSYLKMFFDILIPDISGKLVYIDCDTAVTGSLSELLDLDMKENAIGMVLDSLVTRSRKTVGLGEKDKYYNSGVILIDIARWKELQCSNRILHHIESIRTYGTVDQDVLNVELKDYILTLPIKYNLQPVHLDYSYDLYSEVFRHKEEYYSKQDVETALDSPAIVHYLRYIGESPWNENNVHPGTKYYDYYLSISPWKGAVKKNTDKGGLFRVEKWMYLNMPKGFFLLIFHIIHEQMIIKSNKVTKIK